MTTSPQERGTTTATAPTTAARSSDARIFTVLGAVFAGVAVLFLPIVLGPLGAAFG